MDDPPRWRRYLLDALVETTIARDVLLLTRVDNRELDFVLRAGRSRRSR
jgi:hypothetical protein